MGSRSRKRVGGQRIGTDEQVFALTAAAHADGGKL
jgi:hypothetical protein